MPFRNPISTVGGTITVPALQSPDYAANFTTMAITGWAANNNPSYLAAGSVYGTNIIVGSQVVGNAIDVGKAVYYLGSNNQIQQDYAPTTINPVTTTAVESGAMVLDNPLVPTSERGLGGVIENWQVTAIFDVDTLASPTGAFIGRVNLRQYNASNTLISSTFATAEAHFQSSVASSRATVACVVTITTQLTERPTTMLLDVNTTRFEVRPYVSTTSGSKYRLYSNHSTITMLKTVQIAYTQPALNPI